MRVFRVFSAVCDKTFRIFKPLATSYLCKYGLSVLVRPVAKRALGAVPPAGGGVLPAEHKEKEKEKEGKKKKRRKKEEKKEKKERREKNCYKRKWIFCCQTQNHFELDDAIKSS